MKRFKLTIAAKVIIFVLCVAVLGAGAYFGMGLLPVETEDESSYSQNKQNIGGNTNNPNTSADDDTIYLSLDEWIGWKPIISANGGMTTQPGSIFDQKGINVEISVINDAETSSNALISGSLNAAGYTTNRVAFLSGKFSEAGFDFIMPVYTNYSNGGDGIIAKSEFNTIESLVNAKIGVPRYSEAHTLVVWFVNQSDLSESDKMRILNENLVYFDTPDEAALAFFSGNVDAAATWQPYLSQAESTTDSIILFDTTASNKLILDGVVFNKDWAESHRDVVEKFIDGIFEAEDTYLTEFDTIRNVMPMFSTMSDEEIKSTAMDAGLANYANNVEILEKDAPYIYSSMCDVWTSIGETVNKDLVNEIFDTSYVKSLESKYATVTANSNTVRFTDEAKEEAINAEALLTKSVTFNFVADTAKFLDSSDASVKLKEFVDIAKTLDGTIIQVEGNINAVTADEAGQKLSEERAKTVANYFIQNGIDPNRIIIVGNGNSKMIGDPNTEEGKEQNRRTDVFFKRVEN